MKEKLRNKVLIEESSQEEVSASEDEKNLMDLRKKMSKNMRDDCNFKVAARLKQVGAIFPEETDSSTSGTDGSVIGNKNRRKSRVKSGAKIKKRPVVQTELWPHTIANEDDGEEVTSETIGLSKFLSCFTYIMISCGKVEAKGRAAFLHGVCAVFECLPWTEARAFHNLIMVKLEQGRIDWDADFSSLADSFLDKKVRLNLRAMGSAAGGLKSQTSNKSLGKGFGGSNYYNNSSRNRYGNYSGRDRALYSTVCRQFNFGTCTYGDRCKKWHVCWSCAEAGKMGEQHKASTHENSTPRARPNNGV